MVAKLRDVLVKNRIAKYGEPLDATNPETVECICNAIEKETGVKIAVLQIQQYSEGFICMLSHNNYDKEGRYLIAV
ncbi:hypothetical protein [Endozoicomonas sp.]|uniref:hypothetical protein n=1 Tax=Endozoicomonas sp. TaxID=1892382 RepID=UPI003AF79EE6